MSIETGASRNSSVPTVEDNGVQLPPAKKQRSTHSKVWNYMNQIEDEAGVKYAECQRCGSRLTRGGTSGTSHITKHLVKCYPEVYQDKNTRQVGVSVRSPRCDPYDAKKIRKKIAIACMKHKYPFNIAEHDYLVDLMKTLNQKFEMPSANTIRSDVIEVFEEEKLKAYFFFDGVGSRVSITTDLWKSDHSEEHYLALTSHYINDAWVLQKRLIGLRLAPDRHDGESLFVALKELLVEWNLERKVFSIVVDNFSGNKVMVDMLRDWLGDNLILNGDLFHIRCSAHILNLVVQDGLAVIEELLKKIRETVKYLKKSSSASLKLELIKSRLHLSEACKVAADVPTRWNSTYLMLKTALPLKEALEKLALMDKGYKFNPSKEEWEVGEKLLDCLYPFYEATRHFSGSKYPTCNIFFPTVCKIKLKLMQWDRCDVEFMKAMCGPMLEKFDKYWDCCCLGLAVASIFDLRYKFKGVEFYYSEIYGDDCAPYIARVRECLNALFVTYGGSLVVDRSRADVVGSSGDAEFEQWCGSSSTQDKSELDIYLEGDKLGSGVELDVVEWWSSIGKNYPILRKIARDLLAVPASTVASEAAFSIGGRVITASRSRLKADVVEALVVGGEWINYLEKGSKHSECYPISLDGTIDLSMF